MNDGWHLPVGHGLLSLPEAGSTNTVALTYAERLGQGALRTDCGAPVHTLWVHALRQVAGKGRAGRPWSDPDGNLAITLLTAVPLPPDRLTLLPLLAGLIAHDALCEASPALQHPPNPERNDPPRLMLKWPNDLMINEAKLGGILIEIITPVGAPAPVAAVGIGINISRAPDIPGRAVVALADVTEAPTVARLVTAMIRTGAGWLATTQANRGRTLHSAWLSRAAPVGSRISVNQGDVRLVGVFDGIDESGALRLQQPDGRTKTVTFGDVSVHV